MPAPHSVDDALAAGLADLPASARLCVAFSGGRDSTVLLDACRRLAGPRVVRAVHVHHGLAAGAEDWARHCAAFCAARAIPFDLRRVVVERAGRGLEAAARTARYAALAEVLGAAEYLLTAHHADDQLETLLLHLARGSGIEGLAGIPRLQAFGRGYLWRPLLDLAGTEIAATAAARGLGFVRDPANADPALDRSFLRARVLPVLAERFPAMARAAARSATHAAEAAGLLADVARADAAAVGSPPDAGRVATLAPARQRNLVRFLARTAGLPVPPELALRAGLPGLLGAAPDRNPALRWPGAWLRRYRGALFLLPDPGPEPLATPMVAWDGREPLSLGPWRGRLRLRPASAGGLAASAFASGVVVGFRHGALQLRPAGDRHHRSLKYLCQTAGVFPWMRPHLPLVFGAPGTPLAERLLAVADLWTAADAAAAEGEAAVELGWDSHPPVSPLALRVVAGGPIW